MASEHLAPIGRKTCRPLIIQTTVKEAAMFESFSPQPISLSEHIRPVARARVVEQIDPGSSLEVPELKCDYCRQAIAIVRNAEYPALFQLKACRSLHKSLINAQLWQSMLNGLPPSKGNDAFIHGMRVIPNDCSAYPPGIGGNSNAMKLTWCETPEKTGSHPCPMCEKPAHVDRGCLRGTYRLTCECGYSCTGHPDWEGQEILRDIANSGPPMIKDRLRPLLKDFP
jgi:hypothetical protein